MRRIGATPDQGGSQSGFVSECSKVSRQPPALRRKPRLPQHLAFLTVLGLCFAVRWAASEARPPPDPAPPLLAGLRGVAEELDRDFSGRYAPDAARLDAALAKLPPPGFRRLGRTLPLHVRVLSAEGPQLQPLAGDEPGTIYIAISSDAKSAWLTALALGRVLPQRIEAHSGTHSLPGRDPLVPAYPGMRSVAQPR